MADYYFDGDAADASGDGSSGSPWQRLSNISTANAGDTCYLRGTFTYTNQGNSNNLLVPRAGGGTYDAPITIIGNDDSWSGGVHAILDGEDTSFKCVSNTSDNYVHYTGLDVRNTGGGIGIGINIELSTGCVVRDCKGSGNRFDTIKIKNSDDCKVLDCTVQGDGDEGRGIAVSGAGGGADACLRNQISNCSVKGFGLRGITVSGDETTKPQNVQDILVSDCTVENNGEGIAVDNSQRVSVVNLTCKNNNETNYIGGGERNCGVAIYDNIDLTFKNITVSGHDSDGVIISVSAGTGHTDTRITFDNFTISDNSGTGIKFNHNTALTIDDYTFNDGTISGHTSVAEYSVNFGTEPTSLVKFNNVKFEDGYEHILYNTGAVTTSIFTGCGFDGSRKAIRLAQAQTGVYVMGCSFTQQTINAIATDGVGNTITSANNYYDMAVNPVSYNGTTYTSATLELFEPSYIASASDGLTVTGNAPTGGAGVTGIISNSIITR